MKHFTFSVNGFTIDVDGLVMYHDTYNRAAAETILTDYLKGLLVFDDLYGSYIIRINIGKTETVFADNSGMRRFFIDREQNRIACTFDSLIKDGKKPNYPAIAQFLHFECIYTNETILEGVYLNDPDAYYKIQDGVIQEFPKGLKEFAAIQPDEKALEKVMSLYSKAINDWKHRFCTITGGTDSRAVLSHLLYNRVKPELDITGSRSHIDVQIAQQIASMTGLDLHIITDEPEKDWIDDAIGAAAKGCTGVCGNYRLYKKAKYLGETGDVIECGGFAGETFKNSFINQDTPFYFGRPDWDRFLRYKVVTFRFPEELCGENTVPYMHEVMHTMREWAARFTDKKKHRAYIYAGYRVLQQRNSGICILNSSYYDIYSPLLERNVAAYAFHKSPYSLVMQSYQRRQVEDHYPALRDVHTDRGLTCNIHKVLPEMIRSLIYGMKIYLVRTFNRAEGNFTRVDASFEEGLKSERYAMAIRKCQELGIIKRDVQIEKIPVAVADRLLILGSIL